MKKFLFTLLCGFGLAATAQVANTDLSVTLNTPTAAQNIVPGQQFNVSATITNNGTVALTPADTILCYIVLNNNPLRNANNQLIGRLITENIPVNGTTNFSLDLTFTSIQGGGTANFCVLAIHDLASDADSTDNLGCQSVTLVEGTVSTGDELVYITFEDKTNFSNGNLNVNVRGVGFNENVTVEVINIAGQIVASENFQSYEGRVEESLSINNQSGILIYRIIGEDGKIHATRKFIAK